MFRDLDVCGDVCSSFGDDLLQRSTVCSPGTDIPWNLLLVFTHIPLFTVSMIFFFFLVNSQRAFWGFSHFWVYLQNYFRLWLSLSWKFGNVPHLCAFPPLVLFCVMVPVVVGLHQGSGHCDLTGGIPWPLCWEHAWICLHWSTYGALQALEAEMSLFRSSPSSPFSVFRCSFQWTVSEWWWPCNTKYLRTTLRVWV